MEESCRKRAKFGPLGWTCLTCCLWSTASCQKRNLTHPLRFWIDEYAFSAGETTILREEIQEVGSKVAIISGETRSAFLSVKGYYTPHQWDIYWTGRQGCVQALPHALPGHKISCVPGLHELTMKDRLIARLTQFYGEGAFDIIPRSYLLPTQYWQWRMWLAAQESDDRGEMWVLKEERHRGKGVHVMPLKDAIRQGKVRRMEHNYDLVQAYISNQMTVIGRKFYVRLWAVVTSSFPLRAYLFNGGVVVFGNTTPDDKKLMSSEDFIVNLWHLGRNTEAPPWSIADFQEYLDNLTGSKDTFDALWQKMQRSLGLTFAAGVPAMRFSAASLPVAAASATFELVGVDFLVDENLKPWLLEVNAVPSLARKVIDCEKQPGGCSGRGEAESVFDIEKEKLVHSLFRLLQATAGTNITGTASNDSSSPITLADFLARWQTNATDIAAMKEANITSYHAVSTELGWTAGSNSVKGNESNDESPMSLSYSGRELRSLSEAPVNRSDAPVGPTPTHEVHSLKGSPDSAKVSKGRESSDSPSITLLTRTKSVASATKLNHYVAEADRTTHAIDQQGSVDRHDELLEEHLFACSVQEVQVAVANRFLPLVMIPEAAKYSAEHQTRGYIYPEPKHKARHKIDTKPSSMLHYLFLPFHPVVSAYGELAGVIERLRLGIVMAMPEINNDVTMGVASMVSGADWLVLKGYQLFGWGDRKGTMHAFSVLPKHKLDQRLADYVEHYQKSEVMS